MIEMGTFRGARADDLDRLRNALRAADPAGRLAPIRMRSIVIGFDVLERLPAIVESVRRAGPVMIVQDATAMRRGDDDLKALVAELLRTVATVRISTIGRSDAPLHADAAALAEADRAVAGAGCVVAVGSGTITDLAKDATHRAGDLPLVVVQTAVSVNAFSDDMAVLLRDGVKRTVPSRWPDALLIDGAAIVAAPPTMNRAGFGELASMFTAPADWYLASALGVDDTFHPAAVALFRDSADDYLDAADGVRDGLPEATLELARIMTLSGIALGVAARTAPLSGTEHLVSHLLDMAAAARGTETAFHGAQVGVASIIVSLAWRRFLAEVDPARLGRAAGPGGDGMRDRVLDAFRRIDGTGAAARECWRAFDAKQHRLRRASDRLADLADSWDEHRGRIHEIVIDPADLVDALRRAGAPTRFRDLDPAVDAETARWAIVNCFLMRDRVTMVDLADRAGIWNERFVESLLDEADALGAGL